jgi:hypothetical protein
MQFQGAVIKEQGVTFAIVIVKPHILNNTTEANKIVVSFMSVFGGIPVILMAQDSSGTPTYYGRKDIVNFMANVPLEFVQWKEYTLS